MPAILDANHRGDDLNNFIKEKLMTITKTVLNKLRGDFADAVKFLEAEYKVKIDLGTISYTQTSFHSKMTVTEVSLGENGTLVVSESHFKKCAMLLGVPET